MKVKEEIFTRIKRDYQLRVDIANAFNIRIETVIQWGQRKSHTRLSNFLVARYLKERLNVTDEQYFEEPATCKSL